MGKEPIYGMINIRKERELARASYEYIEKDITDIKTEFIRLGFHLAECQDMKYYEDFGYTDFYQFVADNWKMEKTAVSRHISIFKKFSAVSEEYQNNHKMWLDDRYKEFNYSQLSEMLQMNDKQMSQIKPEMTVKQIRELKKSWKEPVKTNCDCIKDIQIATSQQKEESLKIVSDVEYKEVKQEKQAEVSDNYCEFDDTYICQIADVIREKFYPEGKIDECTGCCIECKKKNECEYTCSYTCSLKLRKPDKIECQYLKAAAEKIIKAEKKWMLEDFEKRVSNVITSPVELKEKLGIENRTWYFPYEEKIGHINFFDNYVQIWNERSKFIGNYEWFYFAREIIAMWNILALEEPGKRVECPEEEKSEFPVLKNMEERENFVLGFKEWNIWCQNELTEEIYYRYDLPDGAAIVIRNYPIYLEWKKEEIEGEDLFLLKSGYKHFRNCETNMTDIKNYLKDLQKKK